jgi:aldehyde:ferredoxin oxidoreductase
MVEMIGRIAARQGMGDILAEGAFRAAQKLGGSDWVVHSKGMDYPAVDTRGTKGMALSFAVSPRGGDHLKGLSLYEVAPEIYAHDIKKETGIAVTPQYWLEYETKARLLEEPIATGPARGERLDKKSYERMLTEYYRLRGWDPETGIPTRGKREELELA